MTRIVVLIKMLIEQNLTKIFNYRLDDFEQIIILYDAE